jgi:hypothetical protein
MENSSKINWWTVRIALLMTFLIALHEENSVSASPVALGGFEDGIIIFIIISTYILNK